jgi:GNAT superfamily N-acetyltransferase
MEQAVIATVDPVDPEARQCLDAYFAELKRMWVDESIRGLGVGRRILVDLEARATSAGVRTLRLETNETLVEAVSLYRSAGYLEVPAFNDEPYAHHWFEKHLTAESQVR